MFPFYRLEGMIEVLVLTYLTINNRLLYNLNSRQISAYCFSPGCIQKDFSEEIF